MSLVFDAWTLGDSVMGVVVAKKRREFMMSDGDKIYFTVSCSRSVSCFLIFLQLFVVPKTDVSSSSFSLFSWPSANSVIIGSLISPPPMLSPELLPHQCLRLRLCITSMHTLFSQICFPFLHQQSLDSSCLPSISIS